MNAWSIVHFSDVRLDALVPFWMMSTLFNEFPHSKYWKLKIVFFVVVLIVDRVVVVQ